MKRVVAALVASVALIVPSIAAGTHPRPKGASPVRAPLVPAYVQCSAPDRTHGPPLAFGSCAGPRQVSGHLTIGTPDANGNPVKSTGSFRVVAHPGIPGPPTDNAIGFHVNITDVRCTGASAGCPGPGEDYPGSTEARIPIQFTDHENFGGPGGGADPATGEFTLVFEVACVATADPEIGSTCSVDIAYIESLNLYVHDGARTSWEFGPLQVWDPGADGDWQTHADNTLFAVQGIFIP